MNKEEAIKLIEQTRKCNNCGKIGTLKPRNDIPMNFIFQCTECEFFHELKIELEEKKENDETK